MGLTDSIFKIFGYTKINNTNVITDRVGVVQKGLLSIGQDSNQSINLKRPEVVSTIYQVAKLLGEFTSRVPIYIYLTDNKGNKILNAKHPWYYTLKYQPNAFTSNQKFISTLIAHLVVRGNAYASINSDRTLTIIHPDSVVAAKVYQGDLWYWIKVVNDDGSTGDQLLKSGELIHLRYSSVDGIFGMNPIQSLQVQLNTNYKGNNTVQNFFSKNATSTKYLQEIPGANGRVGNQNITELIKQYSEKISGHINAFGLFALPEGFTITELGLNTEMVKFLDSGRITRNEIAAIYGIPVAYLNTENTVALKYEEINLMMLSTIENLINILKSEFESKLLSKQEKLTGNTIDWDYWKLNQTNLADSANALKLASTAGAISPNDFARALNLPVSNNPNMDKHYIQSQNVSIEDGLLPPVTPTNNNPDNDQNDNGDNNKQ